MSLWMALVIVQGTFSAPMPLVNKTNDGPASVFVGPHAPDEPNVTLDVQAQKTQRIERMTGVEADTYVNVPTTVTLTFASKELCDIAITALQKQGGVYSVSCVQTQ